MIFGDPFIAAGIKLFYLRYRNWSRFKGFEGKFYYLAYFQKIFTASICTTFMFAAPFYKTAFKKTPILNLME